MKNLIRNILKESDWDFMDDIDSRHPLLNLLEGVDYKMWVGNITDEERDTISSQLHTLFPNETKNIENNYKIFTAIYFDWNLGHHYLEFGTNNVDSNFKEEQGTELPLDILLDNHMNESEDKDWDFMDDVSEIPSTWDVDTLLTTLKDLIIVFKYDAHWEVSQFTGIYKYKLVGDEILLYHQFKDGTFEVAEGGTRNVSDTKQLQGIVDRFNDKSNLRWEVIDFEPKEI